MTELNRKMLNILEELVKDVENLQHCSDMCSCLDECDDAFYGECSCCNDDDDCPDCECGVAHTQEIVDRARKIIEEVKMLDIG